MLSRARIYIRALSKLTDALFPYGKKIIVNEYPKSGGTWLCTSISAASGYVFRESAFLPSLSSCVLHTHRFWLSDLASRSAQSVYLVRNPFDVYVSLYYHCLFRNDKFNSVLVDHCSKVMGDDFMPDNFGQSFYNFLSILYDHGFGYLSTWERHVSDVDFSRVRVVRYEDLWDNNEYVVRSLLSALNISCDSDALKLHSDLSRSSILSSRRQFDKSESASSGKVSFSRRGGYGSWRTTLEDRHFALIYPKVRHQLSRFGYQDMIQER